MNRDKFFEQIFPYPDNAVHQDCDFFFSDNHQLLTECHGFLDRMGILYDSSITNTNKIYYILLLVGIIIMAFLIFMKNNY